MRYRWISASLALATAVLWCPGTVRSQPLYPVPGQDAITVPLPLGHDRMETGGFFTAFEFVMLKQQKALGSQAIAYRGLIDANGQITRNQRINDAIAGGITDPFELASIQGSPGTYIGDGTVALNSTDLGPTEWQPGFQATIGYKFDNGVTLSLSYLYLVTSSYRSGASLVPPGFRGPADLSNSFLVSEVFNFDPQYAGPLIDTPIDLQPGNGFGATYGIWNAAETMTIRYRQRFVQTDITARIPLFDSDCARIYGLAGGRFAWFHDRFEWRTVDLDVFGEDQPQWAASYYNILSQRMYGPMAGFGYDYWLGGALGITFDVTGSLLMNVVKKRVKYKSDNIQSPQSKMSDVGFGLVPNINAGVNLWWYPLRGVQIRAGYGIYSFFNTQEMTEPVGFNFMNPNPAYDSRFVRFLHGFNVGIGLVF